MDGRAMSKSCDQSLCEKSMEVVANIIKLSSFSFALKTVGTTSGKTHRGLSTSGSEYADMVVPEREQLVRDQVFESNRLKEPKSRGNSRFVTDPVLSDGSTSHVQELKVPVKQKKEESVDSLAAEYIRKTRKQLGYGSQKT